MAEIEGQQGQSQEGTQQGQEGAGGDSQPARPEYVPEKFWKDGATNVEALAKSYGELEKQRGKFAEQAKGEARAALEAEIWGKRPEKPEAYDLRALDDAGDVGLLIGPPPADFAAEPGKTYIQLNPDSKALGLLRGMAHRAGASQEEMQALLTEVARENGVRVPTDADRQAEATKVYAELGEHGQRRAQHLWGQMRGVLGDRAADLEGVLGDAKAIAALEEVMARATGTRFAPSAAGGGPGPLTEREIEAMMRDPLYLKRDPAFMAKVDQAWKTLYPG